jgi:hypothetical protein
MAVGLGRLDQLLDLVRGQVLAGTELGIRRPLRRNCSIFSAWRDQSQVRFAMPYAPLAQQLFKQ